MMKYHQTGTWRYLLIKRAWVSGYSCKERRAWIQICLRKYKMVCTIVAVIPAKLSSYDIAKVVDKKSGLYS